MLKNFIKIAWRNIARHRVYSTVNVLGLTLGICACLVLYLIVIYEFSFDRFHPDGDRIYRIVGERTNERGEKSFINSVYDDVAGFETQIPGFASKSGFYWFGFNISVPDDKGGVKQFENQIPHSYSSTAILAKSTYFDIFKHDWLAGNAGVLDKPFQVVLTESRARLYFGNISPENMIGRPIIYADSLKVNVGGIVRDWTQNSDFAYTDYISLSSATHSFLKQRIPTEDWRSLNPHRSQAFVKLDKGVTPEQVNARFASFIVRNLHYKHGTVKMYLQPLSSAHFAEWFRVEDDGDDWRKPYLPTLYVLMGVAVFILLLACINFVNLSTAQSIQRAKEIGVRKVLGSGRARIMGQFYVETLVLTLMAAVASISLVRPVLALFKDYVPDGVVYHPFSLVNLAFMGIVICLTTLLAGAYPARVLASYLPVLSLKGAVDKAGTGRSGLRKALIVFQFAISLIFIIGAIVIAKQIRFMRTTDKGFNTDAVITLNHWGPPPHDKIHVLAERLKSIPGVDKVLLQDHAPMGFAQMGSTFSCVVKDTIQTEASVEAGDDGFIPFYQMRLVAGRNMFHGDSVKEVVINETMTRALGFHHPQDAIGQSLSAYGGKKYPIVGVVADFHMESFHNAIKPAVIVNWTEFIGGAAVRLSPAIKTPAQVKAVLARMEAESKKVYPDEPFNYSFLNESITWLFGQEQNTAWLATAAMCITIFISCMGLFGLAMFSAERRVKEIGIRKVLGAGVGQIVVLLNRDFVGLVCLALVIASPVAWYFSHQWLQDFVYRTTVSWWVFVLAGTGALCIALGTVTFLALRAARANPVKSLRTE